MKKQLLLLALGCFTLGTFAQEEEKADIDLLLYFALALVALLFVEWWLQSREQF